MLYFKIKNYEEFNHLFGTRVANNGKTVRSNSILLSFWKHEFKNRRFENLNIKSVDELYNRVMKRLGYSRHDLANGRHLELPDYYIDNYKGVCEDGNSRCIRYRRNDNDRVFKMKAGKLMRIALQYEGMTGLYCEQVIIYLCERFAEEWQTYVESNYNCGYTLHVDDDFEFIYNRGEYEGDFNSCMAGHGQYSFYEDAVKAKAACLTNRDGKIVARCVIFTEVHDNDSGCVYRLAERQYSSNQDNVLKQILVTKLIEAGEIDGYKQIGVDCHNARGFILNDGTSLKENRLWIECNLEPGDTLSYQDSFKWYDLDCNRADNYCQGQFDLATTDGTFQDDGEYDDYHDYYCDEVRLVHVWNSSRGCYIEYHCDVERLDDFYYCEGNGEYYDYAEWSNYGDEWIPNDECVYSEWLGTYLWGNNATYCEEMEDYLPDSDFDEEFEAWKEQNWNKDEYNGGYVENVTSCYIWNSFLQEYEQKNVESEYAAYNFYSYEGEFYDEVNEDGIPYHLVEELEECEAV